MSDSFPPRLLRDLIQAGVTLDAAPALAIFPAVYTAWADGIVQRREHNVIEARLRQTHLPEPAVTLVRVWLDERPDNAEALLDLSWQLLERMAPPAQRAAAADALLHARAVARAAGSPFDNVSATEQEALDEVVRALGGNATETERRRALRWGNEVEELLPGYRVCAVDEAEGARGPSAPCALDDAWPELCTIESDPTQTISRPRSSRTDLKSLVEAAYDGLTAAERDLLGTDRPLRELSPWQLCRFVVLLVCSRSTYDDGHAERVVEQIESGEAIDSATARRLLHLDTESTASLLTRLVEEGEVPLICRDYARLTCELFAAAAAIGSHGGDAFIINMLGWHDLRSAAGHAWCCYVDRRRRLAVPLDPTSADGLWDIGAADTPFNDLLDGRGMANLSSLCGRLVWAPAAAAAAGLLELADHLDGAMRTRLAIRMLGQPIATAGFSADEIIALLDRAREAPALLTDTLRARLEMIGQPEAPAEEDLVGRARRARLLEVVCRAHLIDEDELPERWQRELLDARKTRMHRLGARRNDPCPCGSGKKFKRCCGR